MLTYLELENFRCFDELKIDNIDRINLIAGENNVGKSAVLEAISQCSNISNPNSPLIYDYIRGRLEKDLKQGPWYEPPWTNLFRDFELSRPIGISFNHTTVGKNKLAIRNIDDSQEILKIILTIASGLPPERRNISNIAELSLKNIEIETESNYLLSLNDIINWDDLTTNLLNHNKSFENLIWISLSNEFKNKIRESGRQTIPDDNFKSTLLDEFNRIIENPNFYNQIKENEFKFVPDSTRSIGYEYDDSNMNGKRKLNREFLEVAFPNSIIKHFTNFYWAFDKETLFSLPTRTPFTYSSYYISSKQRETLETLADMYGRFEAEGRQEEIIEYLKIIEPRLRNLKVILKRKEPIIHGILDGEKKPIPLYLMGDGIVRLMEFIQILSLEKDRIILIDEIENGLHHSVLKKVWKAIAQAARRSNAQVFATTHSYECIRAAHRAFSEGENYDFRLHRLERVKGKIKAITYSKESLEAALEMNWEVR